MAQVEHAYENVDNPTSENHEANQTTDGLSQYEPKLFQTPTGLAELSLVEKLFYVTWNTCVYLYCGYKLYGYSRQIERSGQLDNFLGEGWSSTLGMKRDGTDPEWDTWLAYVYEFSIIAFIHIVMSSLTSLIGYQYRQHAWLIVGVAAVMYLFGFKSFIFIVAILGTLYWSSMSGSVPRTWVVSFGWLTIFNYDSSMWMHHITDTEWQNMEPKFFYFYTSTAFFLLRVISFALEKAKRINGSSELPQEITFSVFDALVYGFYFPNFFTGPMFVYKYFQAEVVKPRVPWSSSELYYITHKTIRALFWMLVLEINHHCIYINLISRFPAALSEMSLWGLSGVVLFFTALYQTGHVVTYGLAGCLMRTDRIVPPSTPRCIVRVPYYSQHWRHFDPGLHGFFRNYVYIPLGGSRHGIVRQVFGTFVTFCFVFYWHGGHKFLALWAGINCSAVMLEMMARYVGHRQDVREFEALHMSPAMIRRFHAALNAPLWFISSCAIMVFLIDLDKGSIYLIRAIRDGTTLAWALVLFTLYSGTIVSQEVEMLEKRYQQKKKQE